MAAVSGVYVRSNVQVNARAFVYVANEISRVFLETINRIGLDVTQYQQPVIEVGLRTWVTLHQLEAAHLEVVDSSGTVRARFDLGITYSSFGEEIYDTDMDELHLNLRYAQTYPGCSYRVVVTLTEGAAKVKGWGDTTLGSVDHLKQRIGGNVINAGRANVSMSTWL